MKVIRSMRGPYKILKQSLLTILFVVTAAVVFMDSLRLFSTTYIQGIDGYYYLLQIESLTKIDGLYFYSSTPLILWFLSGLARVSGYAASAIKVGAILLHLSLSTVVFSIVRSLTKDFWLGIIALFICGVSGLHLYLIVEYISYLGAISFIFWAMYFSLCFVQKRQILYLVPAVISFLAAVMSHRAVLPINLLFIIIFAGIFLIAKAVDSNNRKLLIVGVVGFLLFLIVPALIAVQPFFALSNNWGYEISYKPLFPANLSTFPELLIIFLGSSVFLLFAFYWKEKKEDKIAIIFFGTIAVWGLLITLNPFISSAFGFATIGGRLRVLAYIQAALLVPSVIWLLKDRYKNINWYVGIVVIPLMLWSFLNPLPLGAQPDYLARRERLIEGLKSNLPQIEPNPIIIAAHGEQFVVTHETGIPSQQSFPKENKYNSVYWLLNLVPPTLLDPSMKVIAKDKVGSYTVLVKDGPDFRNRLQNPAVRQLLRAGNRHLDIYLGENGIR